MKSLYGYITEEGSVCPPVIIVTWSELQDWDDRLNHTNKEDVGVYCAIGMDNYNNRRVYIGKATSNDNFAKRMSVHATNGKEKNDEFLQKITRNRRIMYGTLSSKMINLADEKVLNSYITDIEARLIQYFNNQAYCKIANGNTYDDYKFSNTFVINNSYGNKLMPKTLKVENKE